MRNSTASAGAVNTECAESTDPGEQLRLRFFQVIGAYRSNPPEKALIRELLDCALRNVERFMVGGRAVAAHAVHHVALALYCRTDPAGIVEGFSVKVIAADTRLNERTVRPALDVLRRLHVFRSTRTSRRRPASHRINVGGLDWPAVRERGKRASADTMPALGASAGMVSALSADTMPALKGYTEGHVRTGSDGGSPVAAPPDLYRAQESAPEFDPGAAFGLICPTCGKCETGGQECSRCLAARSKRAAADEPDGCPECGCPRLMGGSCEACGFVDGEADFAPNPDFNREPGEVA